MSIQIEQSKGTKVGTAQAIVNMHFSHFVRVKF